MSTTDLSFSLTAVSVVISLVVSSFGNTSEARPIIEGSGVGGAELGKAAAASAAVSLC